MDFTNKGNTPRYQHVQMYIAVSESFFRITHSVTYFPLIDIHLDLFFVVVVVVVVVLLL